MIKRKIGHKNVGIWLFFAAMLLEDICNVINDDVVKLTARKMSKYRVFSGPYFLVFGLNTEIYGVNLRI